MLKNTLDSYVGQVEELLDWISTKTSSYLGIPNVKVSLTPFQLTDDESLKIVLTNLISTGNVSMSTVYESLGRSYEEELEKIAEDAKLKARHDVRVQFETEQAQYLEGLEINKLSEKDDSYMETLKECQSIAQQLTSADPMSIRLVLDNLRVTDYAKYLMVSKLIDEASQNAMTSAEATGVPGEGGEENSTESSNNPIDKSNSSGKNSDSSKGKSNKEQPTQEGTLPQEGDLAPQMTNLLEFPQGNLVSQQTDPKKKVVTKK
jgi:hypothetical protein